MPGRAIPSLIFYNPRPADPLRDRYAWNRFYAHLQGKSIAPHLGAVEATMTGPAGVRVHVRREGIEDHPFRI